MSKVVKKKQRDSFFKRKSYSVIVYSHKVRLPYIKKIESEFLCKNCVFGKPLDLHPINVKRVIVYCKIHKQIIKSKIIACRFFIRRLY